MAKKMLIDATHAEETRVVVVDGTKVEEFDFESVSKRQIAGNIYLAKVTRVEPSLQAAFVDYGGNRHGFLAFSEIHPDYYQIPVADREAILAEELAYAEAEAEDDEPKPKKRRSRRKKKPETTQSEEQAVESAEAQTDQPVAEATKAADPAEPPAEDPSAEGAPEVAEVSDVEPTDGPGAETGDDEDKGPSTMAHAIEGDDPTVTSEDAAPVPDEAEAAPVEGDKKIPGMDVVEASGEDGPLAVIDDADTSAEAETPGEQDAPATEPEAEAPVEKPKRRRSRRRKKDEEQPAETPAEATEEDSPAATEIEDVADTDVTDEIVRPRKPVRRYKIQEVVKVRQVMLVQVVKEERGNKGAALTTYLSLAGRYCVLMPNTARGGGISRKITNAADRKKLKEIAGEIDVPKGAGLIIRTAGAKRTKTEIKRDYEYLKRLWEQIRDLTLKSSAPAQIYEEGNLIKRSIRDLYSRDIDEVLVEGEEGYRLAKDFMKMLMPSHAKNVKLYTDALPLFARFQVESYLAGMFNPTVQLKSGGYLVIGITEALVAIDVNSGRATKEGSIEETALKTNLEAAEEVARQVRLRDLAGLIVIDFIDMEERRNNNAVEKRLKDKLKTDRARIQVGRISGFGLLEMSRQRLRPGMLEITTQPCNHCHGTGLIRSDNSLALSIVRALEEEGMRRRAKEVLVRAPVDVINYLFNEKREHIALIEGRHGLSVRMEADGSMTGADFNIERFKTATRVVAEAVSPVISGDLAVVEEADIEEDDASETGADAEAAVSTEDDDKPKKRRRRRRRRRGGGNGDASGETNGDTQSSDGEPVSAQSETDTSEVQGAETSAEPDAPEQSDDASAEKPKRRRRRRKKSDDALAADVTAVAPEEQADTPVAEVPADALAEEPVPEPEPVAEVAQEPEPEPQPEPEAEKAEDVAVVAAEPEPAAAPEQTAEPDPEAGKKPKRRGWWSMAR
ncbi:Rne/Rng family ribonuclease [Tropicimonas sp. S265A]|uniref:Rne/Rng family ribonuclease n=1 Tax=Tropicimonas sp. S265A TaxID=3415134 RepID=UPI003C7B3B8C